MQYFTYSISNSIENGTLSRFLMLYRKEQVLETEIKPCFLEGVGAGYTIVEFREEICLKLGTPK